MSQFTPKIQPTVYWNVREKKGKKWEKKWGKNVAYLFVSLNVYNYFLKHG